MKKLKVSIQDEQTLVLREDGAKGDVIDLRTLHETDIDSSTITNVVNSIKKMRLMTRCARKERRLSAKWRCRQSRKVDFCNQGASHAAAPTV